MEILCVLLSWIMEILQPRISQLLFHTQWSHAHWAFPTSPAARGHATASFAYTALKSGPGSRLVRICSVRQGSDKDT